MCARGVITARLGAQVLWAMRLHSHRAKERVALRSGAAARGGRVHGTGTALCRRGSERALSTRRGHMVAGESML